ncbi:ABC transporter permease [Pseudooceanicola sp. CBS1P-1]|uniref:ABC transporter permease subunit n=1 Tax=Pseudooceanicola albus TaxID=2692189 RepID=A0A6L7G5F7_9RHOB|nr:MULTISPECIES: ABC transporter permease [Pseudooceanicola]MBT9385384.1 ABC transporter permease [Pseudooceanicola endophyticus]MXN18757.1 ABC transporter permease subunit [Pseudooceanicola albus]
MNAQKINSALVSLYLVLFFLFLLGPLLVMAVSAFNTPSYPQVWPIRGVTLNWFVQLFHDKEMLEGLRTSVVIGVSVSILSVAMGLAGALVMTQLFGTSRAYYYFLVVAPVLIPGIVLGIATVVFWRDFTGLLGLRSLLYNGTVLTILAQSSFVSSYCMLIILARLQRFDVSQEEAALDLGASYPQVFRDVLLPYLRPAILSSAMLGFLTSFENYNATTFAILADKTLTTVLASRVRMGSSPVISALATVIVVLTILAALMFEWVKRREQRRQWSREKEARESERLETA